MLLNIIFIISYFSDKSAERGGFEPPEIIHLTRFPSVLLKPLGHLSGFNLINYYII